MSRTQKSVLAAAAGLVLISALIYFASGDKPSAQLSALKADPLAAYAPRAGRLLGTDTQNEGSAFGKPIHARYSRMFAVPAAGPEVQLERAVQAARTAGWEIVDVDADSSPLGAMVAIGDKTLESGRAQMAITVFVDDTLLRGKIKAPAMKISLEHLGP